MARSVPPPEKMIRKAYDWVLSWADTPHALTALFLIAFIEMIFFPIPPDVLLIAIAVSNPAWWFRAFVICSVGSILGGFAGYGIGSYLYDSVGRGIIEFYHYGPAMEQARAVVNEYGFMGVVVAAFTPLPDKIMNIAVGAMHFDFATFAVALTIGRASRFFLVAVLIYLFGPPIRNFMEKYFDILSALFFIGLIGGFLILKWLR